MFVLLIKVNYMDLESVYLFITVLWFFSVIEGLYGELGVEHCSHKDHSLNQYYAVPKLISCTTSFLKISTGLHHVLGISNREQLYSWGWDGWGQIGVSTCSENLQTCCVCKIDEKRCCSHLDSPPFGDSHICSPRLSSYFQVFPFCRIPLNIRASTFQ